MELLKENDFLVQAARESFTKSPGPLPASPAFRTSPQRFLSLAEIKERRRTSGAVRSLSTVARPDICARLAWLAVRVNSPRGSDIYRIGDSVKTVKEWQQAPVLKYASAPQPIAVSHADVDGRMRARGAEAHCGTAPLAGWPDAAYEDQHSEGRCHLGYATGLTSSAYLGPRHPLRK